MQETIKYEWSKAQGEAASATYFKTRVGRPWILLLYGTVITTLGLALVFHGNNGLGPTGLLLCGTSLLAMPILRIVRTKRSLRDLARLFPDRTIAVTLTDDSIQWSGADFSQRFTWDKLTDIKEVDDFLFLLSGNLLIAALPSHSFSRSQVNFIRSRMTSKRIAQQPGGYSCSARKHEAGVGT